MMEGKLRKYINRKFILYPKTKDILEVREELLSIVLDRYRDCLDLGISRSESYRKAIEIMADYKEALKEVEKGSSLGALKNNLINAVFFSSFYFITLTLIYLFISMVILKTFEKTWLIALGGAFVYLVYVSLSIYRYARLFNFERLARWGIALIYLSLVPLLYIFPSLYMSIVRSRSIWGYSWIIAASLVLIYIISDYIINRKYLTLFQREVRFLASGLVVTTIVYLFISMRYKLWEVSWMLYVVYLALVSLIFFIRGKMGRFKN